MPKFRKKPVTVEAEQWFPGKDVPGVVVGKPVPNSVYNEDPHIQTLEGRMWVNPGDWIITGVAGEKYPCKDEIFRATYEAADAAGLEALTPRTQ